MYLSKNFQFYLRLFFKKKSDLLKLQGGRVQAEAATVRWGASDFGLFGVFHTGPGPDTSTLDT